MSRERRRARLSWRLACAVVFAVGAVIVAVALAQLILPEAVARLWAGLK